MLHSFNPSSVLEYGPGESTKIFQDHLSISLIDTIEHAPAWAEKAKAIVNHKGMLIVEPKHYKYPYCMGRIGKYGIIFIDGIERPSCISVAKFRIQSDGIVVVHDAERIEYKPSYELWKFKYFVDDGHTVFLTDNEQIADKLGNILCV